MNAGSNRLSSSSLNEITSSIGTTTSMFSDMYGFETVVSASPEYVFLDA